MSGCGHIECIGLTACVMPRTVTPGGVTFTEPSRAAAPPVETGPDHRHPGGDNATCPACFPPSDPVAGLRRCSMADDGECFVHTPGHWPEGSPYCAGWQDEAAALIASERKP